jgi:hypothetical protein
MKGTGIHGYEEWIFIVNDVTQQRESRTTPLPFPLLYLASVAVVCFVQAEKFLLRFADLLHCLSIEICLQP